METKAFDLWHAQVAFHKEEETIKLQAHAKGVVLVKEIPTTCSGNAKTDRHYMTYDALTPNSLEFVRRYAGLK